jgi:hypothetical protein
MKPKMLSVVLMMIVISIPVSALTSVPVPTEELKPISHMLSLYHMNLGGAVEPDDTMNGNDAVIYGASASNSSVFGRSYSFSGQDFLAVRNVKHQTAYNISFRVFLRIDSLTNYSTIWSATLDENALIWLGLNGTRIEFQVRDDNGILHVLKSTRTLSSRWVHITAIFNGFDNYMGLFQDGAKVIDGLVPSNGSRISGQQKNNLCHSILNRTSYCIAPLSSSSMTIGATFTNDTVQYYRGSMDELAIYDSQDFNGTYVPPAQTKGKTNYFLLFFLAICGISTFICFFCWKRGEPDEFIYTALSIAIGFGIALVVGLIFPLTALYAPLLLAIGLTCMILYFTAYLYRLSLVPMDYEFLILLIGIVLLLAACADAYFRLSSNPFWIS